jgi:hypothetical protein
VVVEQQRDDVAGPDAALVQPGGEGVHPLGELAVGDPAVPVHQGHLVGPAGGVVVQDVGEVVHALRAPSRS